MGWGNGWGEEEMKGGSEGVVGDAVWGTCVMHWPGGERGREGYWMGKGM